VGCLFRVKFCDSKANDSNFLGISALSPDNCVLYVIIILNHQWLESGIGSVSGALGWNSSTKSCAVFLSNTLCQNDMSTDKYSTQISRQG